MAPFISSTRSLLGSQHLWTSQYAPSTVAGWQQSRGTCFSAFAVLECTNTAVSVWREERKENFSALPPTHSAGRWNMDHCNSPKLSFLPRSRSLPHTQSHILPVFLWIQTKRSDTAVENHEESKVGAWSRGAMNWVERGWRTARRLCLWWSAVKIFLKEGLGICKIW